MRKFIPTILLLFNASVAMAQNGSGEETRPSESSQQIVLEALNVSASHPAAIEAGRASAQPAPMIASGIGPSSNMPQPGDYGYSAWSDLRQLNF